MSSLLKNAQGKVLKMRINLSQAYNVQTDGDASSSNGQPPPQAVQTLVTVEHSALQESGLANCTSTHVDTTDIQEENAE